MKITSSSEIYKTKYHFISHLLLFGKGKLQCFEISFKKLS